jgi:hypothetical protein
MKSYIEGWYCQTGLDLNILYKETNEQILVTLRDSYPRGLTAHEIAERSGIPLKTVYSQLSQLYREYYVFIDQNMRSKGPGRPTTHLTNNSTDNRNREVWYIENANRRFDIYKGNKQTPLPPGNVQLTEEFKHALNKISTEKDNEENLNSLLSYVEKTLRRFEESDTDEIRKWAPEKENNYCCKFCGLNHEARDFVRATLIHLIDRLEQSDKYVEFLSRNRFVNVSAHEHLS